MKHESVLLLFTVLTLSLPALGVPADIEEDIRIPEFAGEAGKKVRPLYTASPPVVDGRLDDTVWFECARDGESMATDFTYRGMDGRHEHPDQTVVRIAFDEENLYFGIECLVLNTDDLVSSVLIRDAPIWIDDSVEIFLDTFNDDKSAYYFMVSVNNTQLDGYISEEGEVENRNWDGIWKSAVSVDRDAWYAEIKLPLRNLRFGLLNDSWGFNAVRFHVSDKDQSTWKQTGDNIYRVSMFGEMAGMDRMSKHPTFDFKPYLSGEYRDNAKDVSAGKDIEAGIDVSSRFIPSSVITATYKPDFAQVESDPYQINLTDEELFFPEKRSFFLDGQQYFDTPIQTFYSRRIGDIEYGGKLLGRVGPTHVYGVALEAYEHLADAESEGSPYKYDYLVGRIKQDITEHAFVGALGVERKGEPWGANRSLSTDFGLSFNDELLLSGQYVYIQDEHHAEKADGLDLSFSRYTSDLSFGGGYIDYGRRLDVVKTGYIPYDDTRGYWGWASYDWWLWSSGIKKISAYADYEHYLNHDGSAVEKGRENDSDNLQREGLLGEVTVDLENEMTFRVSAERNFRRYTGRIWQEEPFEVKLYYDNYKNEYYSILSGYKLHEWNSVYAFYMIGQHFDFDLSYWGVGGTINPIPRLSLEYSIDYEILNDDDWWYFDRTPEDPLDPHRVKIPVKYHYEYVINRLHIMYSFTDAIQARVFVQSSSDLGHYATNALLSWEFLPGSHAYLVYNEKRLFKRDKVETAGRSVLDQLLFFKVDYFLGL
ncbi:MAG: carbohydrate binding family 9 domain-containing protein [bacterium]|nr:carbohydrate binding family 9 domain-containing protein [bacterium]